MEKLERNKTTAAQAIAIEDGKDHSFSPGKKHSAKYFRLLKQRRALPISSRKQEVAATSAAERTTADMGVHLGEEVGFIVRFDKDRHKHTKLLHMTDRTLMEATKKQPDFKSFSCIVIDEAYQRILAVDMLLSLLKIAIYKRPDLKRVVMLASLDAERFVDYFGKTKAAHFALSGRNHPVQITYLKEPTLSTFNMALETRKCICAINIAEASIIVDGIVYVIDLGNAKHNGYKPRMGMDTLLTGPISQAAPRQRANCAGRTKPGFYCRLYTHETFLENMKPYVQLGIHEESISVCILQLKAAGFDHVAAFDFIDLPHPEILFRGLEDLIYI
ncbi:pre-mRNA-splicing factor ATP-dependent RNA helicase prp16 [Fusarium beomiforme]|uniref:Pre-mRNA-splicing factor ATP-dependent RNA helicase prp16 n=1 Tax=Fusarium beomiforme TaxID=44412 RepID=A0A9P5AR59_9HYPO|nr:pre-mRNA-splicing factor ATP-dependent RNA helicase prp16 [Fusarium beomiforme]